MQPISTSAVAAAGPVPAAHQVIRTPARPHAGTGARTGRIVLCTMLVAVLPYLSALSGDFTFDDVSVIRDNPAVQHEPPHRLLTTVHNPGALYRPFTMLTYALNARLSNRAADYHVVNVALHAAVTGAVYALAHVVLASHTAAVVAALLFAVHPAHTEAVSAIVGRAELLAALCALLALLAYARTTRSSGPSRTAWLCASLAALAAALLAKESAFTAIALIPLLHRRLLPDASIRDVLRATIPYAVLGAAYLLVRLAVVGSFGLPAPPATLDNPLAYVPLHVRLATALVVLWQYVALLIMPLQLTADYSFNEIPVVLSLADPRFIVAAAALFTLAVLVGWLARRVPGLALGVCFGLIPLALTANLLFPIGTIKAERLLYLPSFGCCLAVAAVASHALRRSRWPWQIVVLLVMATFASRTWARNYDWRDNLSLFEATVAASPRSAKAHYNVGVALQRAGRLSEAMLHYRRALGIYPAYASAAYGIGRVYGLRGNDEAALHWYREALRRDWHLAKAHLQSGLIHERRGAYTAAEAAFRAGLDSDPSNALLLVNLSAVRLAQGDRWGALTLLDRLEHLPAPDAETVALVATARREIEEAAR